MIKQPKYKFGDKFTKVEQVTHRGTKTDITVVGYVVGIKMTCGQCHDESEYVYELDNDCQYWGNGRVQVEKGIKEKVLTEAWKYESAV